MTGRPGSRSSVSGSRRRQRDQAKAASDIYDIYRLLVDHDRDGGVANALVSGPENLGHWCGDAVSETFVTNAGRSARRLTQAPWVAWRGAPAGFEPATQGLETDFQSA